jgi:hypothetical protein
MNRIAIDIVGPLPKTQRGNTHILTIFDPFSHWPEAHAIAHTGASSVINCIKKHVARHSVPSQILSDRGTQFTSKTFRDFCARLGAKKLFTTPYKPSSNGSVEGFHKYLAKALAALVKKSHTDWDEHLDTVLFAYRSAPMDGSSLTPFEVLFGREPNLPIDNILQRENLRPPVLNTQQHVKSLEATAKDTFATVIGLRKARFERNQKSMEHVSKIEYKPGQKVYINFPKGRFRPIGGATKFSDVNKGPYTVKEKLCHGLVYKVEHDESKFVSNVSVTRIIAAEARDSWEDSVQFPEGHWQQKGGSAEELDPFLSVIPIGDLADAAAEAKAIRDEAMKVQVVGPGWTALEEKEPVPERRQQSAPSLGRPYAAVAPNDLEGYENEDETILQPHTSLKRPVEDIYSRPYKTRPSDRANRHRQRESALSNIMTPAVQTTQSEETDPTIERKENSSATLEDQGSGHHAAETQQRRKRRGAKNLYVMRYEHVGELNALHETNTRWFPLWTASKAGSRQKSRQQRQQQVQQQMQQPHEQQLRQQQVQQQMQQPQEQQLRQQQQHLWQQLSQQPQQQWQPLDVHDLHGMNVEYMASPITMDLTMQRGFSETFSPLPRWT